MKSALPAAIVLALAIGGPPVASQQAPATLHKPILLVFNTDRMLVIIRVAKPAPWDFEVDGQGQRSAGAERQA
jgi:hypothetical protein